MLFFQFVVIGLRHPAEAEPRRNGPEPPDAQVDDPDAVVHRPTRESRPGHEQEIGTFKGSRLAF